MLLKDGYTTDRLNAMSYKELQALAEEIRAFLIRSVNETGGHLASNLGAVELTIALHMAFSTPKDKLVFDVGHQSYVHKILTGRMDRFDTLRKAGGLSGFTRMSESEHDAFTMGHASTAISVAMGLARARKLRGEDHAVVAVVGDGALTGGMCYEALNDAGQSKTPVIVILNDNEMSISPNVGAMAMYLSRLRQSLPYRGMKRGMRLSFERLPVLGKPLLTFTRKIRALMKTLLVNERFFSAMNFQYLGPIDGHDIRGMADLFRRAYRSDEPVLIHVVTQKGRGYRPSEREPMAYHGVAPFFAANGAASEKDEPSYGDVMAQELSKMAERDPRIVAVTAAMPNGTGLHAFAQAHPDRFFDVGIAEEHAVTMAAGMASDGFLPYVAIYSSFMQRAYDQIIVDVAIEKLPVTLLLDRGGLVGADGATHQGVFDLSFLRGIPNMIVAAPRDTRDLRRLLRLSAKVLGPMAIRYPKDALDMGPGMENSSELEVGQWELLMSGEDVMILAVGRMVETALQTSIELNGKSVRCGVIDARFIKPMDEQMLVAAAEGHPLIVTLEDNMVAGGFGSGVMEALARRNIDARVMALGVPDQFIEHAKVSEQMDLAGLTPVKIAQKIMTALKS